MSIRLRDLIRAVRACKTAADERAVIAKECAAIRTAFKDEDSNLRHRNVAKLLYIHMLGYPTHFGQMECLKLIASNKFPEKRIGYLGLMQLLDERQEVLMLVTNSLKNDLNHSTQFVVGLALCALGNIGSEDMCRDLAPEVEKLLASSSPYVRKKAALCSIRIFRKNPDLIENFVPRVRALANDRNHGVLVAGVTAMVEMLTIAPQFSEAYVKDVAVLVRILKSLVLSGYAPEHDVYGITDPFLQVKIIRLLRIIGAAHPHTTEVMGDILAQVATNTETSKTAGNAILYEVVNTILKIDAESGLKVLAINILGRFLVNRDNNIRYVALQTLAKIATRDVATVQRHRSTIVDCLKDSDVSIRRRALELAYLLIDKDNVKILVRELINFLIVANVEFRDDLTYRITTVVEKFAPSKKFHIDSIIQVLTFGGDHCRESIPANLIGLISLTPDLQVYAVRKLFQTVVEDQSQPAELLKVVAWTVGEYGDKLVAQTPVTVDEPEPPIDIDSLGPVNEDVVLDILESLLATNSTVDSVREFIVTALLKLATRFQATQDRIKSLLAYYKRSIGLELQSRAVEFSSLYAMQDVLRGGVLDAMPVPDETERRFRVLAQLGSGAPPVSSSATPEASGGSAAPAVPVMQVAPTQEIDLLGLDLVDAPAGGGAVSAQPVQQTAPSSNADMLLDLLGGLPDAGPPAAQPMPTQGGGGGGDLLGDLLGGGPPAAAPTPVGFPDLIAFDQSGVRVNFAFSKEGNPPNVTTITATYSNISSTPISNFTFLAAVPKFLKLQMQPASGSELGPNGSATITQIIKVANSMQGQKQLAMKLKLEWDQDGGHKVETGQLSNFPPNL